MKLIQIFLPLYDNSGRRFAARMYSTERDALVERLVASRPICVRQRKVCGRTKERPHDMVILEMMVRRVDRKWWNDHRHKLERRFKQKELVVRSQDMKLL